MTPALAYLALAATLLVPVLAVVLSLLVDERGES